MEGSFCIPGGADVVQGIIIQAIFSERDTFVIDSVNVTSGCANQRLASVAEEGIMFLILSFFI